MDIQAQWNHPLPVGLPLFLHIYILLLKKYVEIMAPLNASLDVKPVKTAQLLHHLISSFSSVSASSSSSSSSSSASSISSSAHSSSTSSSGTHQIRNLSSHTMRSSMPAAAAQWPQQPRDYDGFHNCVTFDFLTSGSMHAERLQQSMRTKFGLDSSSNSPFAAWTHTDTYT